MYPKNAVTPPEVAVGSIYLIADGTIQTTGASARVRIGTGAWGAAGGTLACDTTSGVWGYIPTQAETNAESFMVAVYKASSTSASVTVVTSASSVSGNVQLAAAQPAVTFTSLTCTGALTISDGVVITCSTDSKSALKLTGGATAGKGLEIIGTGTGTAITATGAVSLSSTLTVAGTTTLAAITQTGAVSWGATTFASVTLTSGTIPADVQTIKTRAVTDVGLGNTVYLGTAAWSTLTQSQVSGGAYDLTNATFVAAFKAALGTVPASGDWATATNLATVAGYLDTEIAAILEDTGTTLPAAIAALPQNKTGYSLAAAGLDAVVVETGLNARQAMSIIAAASAGKLSGAATTTVTILAAQEATTTRIAATVDADGNRSAVTLTLPS